MKKNANKKLATCAMLFLTIGLCWLILLYLLIQDTRVLALPQAQVLTILLLLIAWPLSIVQWMSSEPSTFFEFTMVVFGMQATLAWWWLSAVFIEARFP
jgi:hypothetical protein